MITINILSFTNQGTEYKCNLGNEKKYLPRFHK